MSTENSEPQDIGTGGGFPPRVWLEHGYDSLLCASMSPNMAFHQQVGDDVEMLSIYEHTALVEQARERARREAAEILKNAAIATNSGKSFAELRRYLLTKREQLLSEARAARGTGEKT